MKACNITASCGPPLFCIPTKTSKPSNNGNRHIARPGLASPSACYSGTDCFAGVNMAKPTITTESEYKAMPPALRRKCFSSLERLRIAENAAASQLERSTDPRIPLYPCLPPDGNPPTSFLRRQSTRSRRLLRTSRSPSGGTTKAEAEWFLSLPDKVRRRHLSQEEQVLLTGHCETLVAYSEGTNSAHLRSCSLNDISASIAAARREISSAKELAPSDAVEDIDAIIKRAFYFLEKTDADQSEGVSPRSSANRLAMTPSPPIRSRRPSFRRTLPFPTNPFARHSISSAPTPFAAISPFQPPPSNKPRTSFAAPRHGDKANVAGFPNAEAAYYQDPEARMKLRLYLASPQKFDEVVEFGFPSDDPIPSPHPHTVSRKSSNNTETSLGKESLSFLDDSEDPDDAAASSSSSSAASSEYDLPLTPSDTDPARSRPRILSSSKYSSIDSAGLPLPSPPPLLRQKTPPDAFAHAFYRNRQMTLRMTLTRPDLRADVDGEGERMCRLRGGDDRRRRAGADANPLALEALPELTDDITGARGPFCGRSRGWAGKGKGNGNGNGKGEGGVVSRLWRSVVVGGSGSGTGR